MRIKLNDAVRAEAWRIMCALSRDYGGYRIGTAAEILGSGYGPAIDAWTRWLTNEDVVRARGDGSHHIMVVGDAPPLCRPLAETFGAAQRNLWRAMQMSRSFSLEELARDASTDVVEVKPAYAQAYIAALTAAGMVVGGTALSNGVPCWRLPPSQSTGPRPPVITKLGVFDLNRGRELAALHARAA